MKRDAILDEWEKDGAIDPTRIDIAAISVPKLQCKYMRILSSERMLLKQLEIEYKKLYLAKFEFYTIYRESSESKKLGWTFPQHGEKVLRVDADKYLAADEELSNLQMRIDNQREKVAILENILKSLYGRNQTIRNHIDYLRYKAGEK